MSKETRKLEIDKCILSKLWYTSLTVCREKDNERFCVSKCNNDTVDFVKSEIEITNITYSQNEGKHQWIAHILLQQLINSVTSETQYGKKQQSYMEMMYALQLSKSLSIHVQEELLTKYKSISEQTNPEILEKIQNEYFILLKRNVYNNPFITCWIWNKLLYCSSISNDSICNLQDLYLALIKELLELKLSKHQSIGDNSFGYVLCIISKMSIDEFNADTLSKWLFPILLKADIIYNVELALYSRADEKLFKRWCMFHNDVYVHSKLVNNLCDAMKIQEMLFNFTSTSASTMNTNKLIERISSNQLHWIIDILDVCYTLLISGKYNDVLLILSHPLLKAILPALLFKILKDCSQEESLLNDTEKNYEFIYDSIEFLISKCNSDAWCDSTWTELQHILKKNIQIFKYILNCTRENIKTEDLNQVPEGIRSVEFQENISIKWIFDLLQHFNSLLVLKMTTNIHEQEYDKIKHLLKDLCEPENIFNAYCTMLNALKAILLCDNYVTQQSTIKSYFTHMNCYIQTIYPLDLRVQVVENIFCLLFLRHKDFDYTQTSYEKNDTDISHEQLKFKHKWMKQHSRGFVCNKYAVRDILFYLKNIVLTIESEYMKIKGNNENIEETCQIQKDIERINAAIIDAKSRLELYTTSEFVEDINITDENQFFVPKSKVKISLGEKLIYNYSKENVLFYQEDSISDDTKIKSNSSSESESMYNSNKWRKRFKNTGLARDGSISKDMTNKSFINFMLATKESLVIRYLWKNDYVKAQDIIETFDMKNSQLNGEMQFSKALHMFKKDIYEQINILKDKDQSSVNLHSSTLENIRLITQEGIKSSRHISQFETFLATQEVNLQMLAKDTLNNDEILTICVLDLALTMSQISSISHNLCEVAMKYLKLCKTYDNTEYVHFFYKFYQLLFEKKDEVSVENILCDAKIILSIKECKEKDEFWTDIIAKHREFKNSQANRNKIDETLKETNYLLGLKTLSKIAAVASGTKKYMQNLCSHFQLLYSIIPTDQEILTVSDLLKIPLHYYFGYQIFELKIEPDELEAIAHDLQINLTCTILTNICPKLFYEKNISYTITSKEDGCIILNKASCKSDVSHKVQGPNQCVSEILTEILHILDNLNLSQSLLSCDVCKNISEYSNIQNVLNKTSRLVNLDLSELSMGNETLTFLLNTWNLMFLHATLVILAHHSPLNNLQHTISLMSIGYLIGDLGLVTLAALRSKLLNNMALNDNFFTQVEELNELAWQDLDITHDPRVIFIMANEFFGTPCIQVCKAETLDETLIAASHEYLNHYAVRCDKPMQNGDSQKIILLPEIAEQYETFISQNLKNHLQNSNDCNNLFSINDYFKSCDEDIVIEYMPPSYSYSIILKYTNCSDTHNQKQMYQYKTTWKTHSIRPSVLQYLESQCWAISYLWQRIQNENSTTLENNCDNLKRTACLENLLNSSWVTELKLLFDNNETIAAILETISIEKLWSHLERMIKENKWNACLKLVNALPSRFTLNTEMQCFKDKVISHIVSQNDTTLNEEILQYLYQIKDVYILSQTILFNISRWPINICTNALLHAAHHIDNYKLSVHCKLQLNETLHRVLIFHKMLPYCTTESNATWYDVAYCTEKIDPLEIIKSLMKADKFELCLKWMECQGFSLEMYPSVTQEFLLGLLKSESQNFQSTLKFFQALPLDQSVKLCKNMLKKLESIDSLRFICNYLLQHCEATEIIKYRRALLGIDILSMLDVQERHLYIHFIKEPLLMLEQLLMNCKFESIQRILCKIQDKLDQADISRISFDKIIRFYAQKSLDCRVSLECDTTENKSKNVQQPTLEVESTEFVMPILVPTKEEWVPNDKARKCSCCKNVIFSMFNRRHHCRRCGRVICATCSQHRMQILGYPPSVLVRVCDDCKRQTALQMHAHQESSSPSSSEIFDYWRLTRDEKHNETIREEFSFEHAPNISLCLAILNLHSEHKTYASFLLDCSDEMKRLLQPVSGGKVNLEIDHTVIIKMIRSLLIAAKVKCAKLGLNTGLVHCDSFLSQVDLIASLVQSDCLHFIPCDDLDDHTLRKLRDLLIEKEQWTLALDVSTKAGLDTQGVWAAWGKICLKMGYFDKARDKFFHCLDKMQYENFDDWVILPHPKELENEEIRRDELKKAEFSKNRPLKDPPLLTEILQILDNLNVYKQYVQYPPQYKYSASQEILSNFGSFKIISQKQHYKNTSATMQNIYYQESLYYLLTYGSYNSILEFFLKYEEFDKCLTFVLENDLEPDLFFNAIYLYCLKNGNIEKLHEAMMSKDSSLLIWKKYLIYVCHSLEKRQYLNILYQLQLFMKDCVRAAMTCIRFYLNEVDNYTELCARVNFLLDAQKHLESELQIETLNRKRKKSTSSMYGNQGILTMEMELSEIDKHINTICRQMEITKFLAYCEKNGRAPVQFLSLFPEKDTNNSYTSKVPTLFGNQEQKIDLAVLTMLCGHNIEEGFGIAFRIMQDYNLPQQKVYSLAGHILIMKNNIAAIEQLIKCCHTSGIRNSHVISDYVLAHCVKLLLSQLHNETESVLKNDIYNLVRLITDIELKINAYIECKQLKAAYLLAVKHSRAQDIRKILKESDRLGQNAIKAICIKWLQQEPKL
ncbi:Zinc finger FYVE domain-containing protein 26 [Anthophora plagiata]